MQADTDGQDETRDDVEGWSEGLGPQALHGWDTELGIVSGSITVRFKLMDEKCKPYGHALLVLGQLALQSFRGGAQIRDAHTLHGGLPNTHRVMTGTFSGRYHVSVVFSSMSCWLSELQDFFL